MSPYKSLLTSFSRGYVEVCVCTGLLEVEEVTLLAEILYLNPNAVLKDHSWRMNQ